MLDDGSEVPCDVLIACMGIVANTGLAADAGLAVNRGIIVDEGMRTSDPRIFAVGDVAELPGAIGGLWAVGLHHGEVAAANIVGETETYSASAATMCLKLPGIDVQSFGRIEPLRSSQRELGEVGPGERSCWRVIVEEGAIVGGVFVAETQLARTALAAFRDPGQSEAALAELRSRESSAPRLLAGMRASEATVAHPGPQIGSGRQPSSRSAL